MASHPCIVRSADGTVLAHANRSEQVIQLEGNWYFHPDCVNHAALEISKRTYLCPYKGTCLWIDMRVGDDYVNDVAWVYPATLPGYRRIAGWYGFYPHAKGYTKTECDGTHPIPLPEGEGESVR